MKSSVIIGAAAGLFITTSVQARDLAIGSELDSYSGVSRGDQAVMIEQSGVGNRADTRQYGSGNGVAIGQSGRANHAVAMQAGSANEASILQSGGYLSAEINQQGVGHSADIAQSGYHKQATINQQGAYGNAEIVQLGRSSTPVSITQYARGRMSVQVVQH